jgi:hypothetical protein
MRFDASTSSPAYGEVAAESSDISARTRTRRELTPAEVQMIAKCVEHLRKTGAFIDARRETIPETVTVDAGIVLIELIDERGYAIGLWPHTSANWNVVASCLTKFYQLADQAP